MRITTALRFVAPIVVALAVAGCSGGGVDDTSTTSPSSSTTTPISGDSSPGTEAFWDAFMATAPPGDIDQREVIETADRLCIGLELLQAAGTAPGHAAEAIARVLVAGLSDTDEARFGTILSIAPSTMCNEVDRYAESVAYWLGL